MEQVQVFGLRPENLRNCLLEWLKSGTGAGEIVEKAFAELEKCSKPSPNLGAGLQKSGEVDEGAYVLVLLDSEAMVAGNNGGVGLVTPNRLLDSEIVVARKDFSVWLVTPKKGLHGEAVVAGNDTGVDNETVVARKGAGVLELVPPKRLLDSEAVVAGNNAGVGLVTPKRLLNGKTAVVGKDAEWSWFRQRDCSMVRLW
ncbi:unnamed protein product [Dovyalis caffra]|uniref:Uncharacterized protein n=1 Tax=Dovyalis caffra TaxID=77055 RepID=A0AAV1RIK2_9ROSI|nr:unnamed protein product [Dovyalis caffra]